MATTANDFITLQYTGKLEDGTVFDTTDEKVAKENGLFNQEQSYGEVTICLGQQQILAGLDQALIGAEVGKHQIMLSAESAFGKKSASLVQLIAISKFKGEGIKPYPGMQVNVDNQLGLVKNVSGGRVLVDFNHPLSGKNLVYDVDIKAIVEDTQQQLQAMVKMMFGPTAKAELKENIATIHSHMPLPDSYKAQIRERITSVIKDIKEITFKTIKKEGQK